MGTTDMKFDISHEMNMWAANVFAKIHKNFADYQINTSLNKKDGYTGDLYRRMWWKVYNSAGGKKSLIQFFYMKYGDYVQWGVGRKFGDPRWPEGQKLWNVPTVTSKEKKSIKNTDGNNYYSKPYLRREVRYQMRYLIRDLAIRDAVFGDSFIVKGIADGLGDTSATTRWIEQNKPELTNDFLQMMGMKR